MGGCAVHVSHRSKFSLKCFFYFCIPWCRYSSNATDALKSFNLARKDREW